MKKGYELLVLPEDMAIFIDTSSFGLDNYKNVYSSTDNRKYSISYLKASTSRLEQLTAKLSQMDNWRIIKEVLEEFKEGDKFYSDMARKIKCRQIASAFKKAFKQREKTLELLRKDWRIINSDGELIELVNRYSSAVEEFFIKIGGKTSERKTDTKIITVALAYANSQSVCVFANDMDLLRTFVDCSKKFSLADNTYILTDRFHEARKTTDMEIYKGALSLSI